MKEKIIDNQELPVKKDRGVCFMMALVSAFLSLIISGFCFFLSFIGNFWFIAIAIYFLLESAFIIAPLFVKDDYKAMKLQGIAQIVGVLFMMPYLLFMILWNDPNGTMDYSFLTYVTFAVAAFMKAMIFTANRSMIKHDYHPLLHAYGNGALITTFYLLTIIELIIVNRFFPGSSTAIFDNLLKEKPIWIYIIDIIINAIFTLFVALLALSTAIRAATKEQLSTSGKIKHTIKWFSDNEISMFFGLIFTVYLAVLAFINIRQSFFYILLFIYYLGTATIRLLNYAWHKRIQKRCGDNIIRENRLSSWILLFDALTYLAFSNVLVLAAIFMMIQKANTGSNIYLFLFMNIPLAIMRLITTGKSIRNNRRNNNTYRLGISLIGLVSLFFTILEIVAIACHDMPIVWIRYVFIILAIIAAKIAVIVVSIIFVIHWFRSIILNRRSKERKYLKEKENR